MSDKLKPCPSCGAKNTPERTLITELYDNDKYKYGKCFNCGIKIYDWNKRPIEDALQARITELEAENAIFRAANYEAMKNVEEVNELNARIAELERQAIIWHKYPDEKPQKTDHYLIHCPILNKRHFDFWHNDIQKWDRHDEYVIHWAYLPEPPDIACDAHIEKSATQAPLPVSGATQAEVDLTEYWNHTRRRHK